MVMSKKLSIIFLSIRSVVCDLSSVQIKSNLDATGVLLATGQQGTTQPIDFRRKNQERGSSLIGIFGCMENSMY
jgi:hypothetical protein